MKRPLAFLSLLLAVGCARDDPGRDRVETEGPRIVVMAPAAAEVLEILGVTDRVVGRGDYVVWPPALQRLPRVGAYHAPSVETGRPEAQFKAAELPRATTSLSTDSWPTTRSLRCMPTPQPS